MIVLGDPPEAWEALGFDVHDGIVAVGEERLQLTGRGGGILEVVERGGDPPRFWGLVVVVDDPGAVPGAGPAKNAVQPGRRIATVNGLGTALAVMSRRV